MRIVWLVVPALAAACGSDPPRLPPPPTGPLTDPYAIANVKTVSLNDWHVGDDTLLLDDGVLYLIDETHIARIDRVTGDQTLLATGEFACCIAAAADADHLYVGSKQGVMSPPKQIFRIPKSGGVAEPLLASPSPFGLQNLHAGAGNVWVTGDAPDALHRVPVTGGSFEIEATNGAGFGGVTANSHGAFYAFGTDRRIRSSADPNADVEIPVLGALADKRIALDTLRSSATGIYWGGYFYGSTLDDATFELGFLPFDGEPMISSTVSHEENTTFAANKFGFYWYDNTQHMIRGVSVGGTSSEMLMSYESTSPDIVADDHGIAWIEEGGPQGPLLRLVAAK